MYDSIKNECNLHQLIEPEFRAFFVTGQPELEGGRPCDDFGAAANDDDADLADADGGGDAAPPPAATSREPIVQALHQLEGFVPKRAAPRALVTNEAREKHRAYLLAALAA